VDLLRLAVTGEKLEPRRVARNRQRPVEETSMSELMMWRLIPKGAKLDVRVTPADGEFAATGIVYHYAGGNVADETWADAELRPGPRTLMLKNSRDYIVDILVSFASAAASKATVSARVVKADGGIYSKPDARTVQGKNGDAPVTVTIILMSQKVAK
jgi:hypothetical protein